MSQDNQAFGAKQFLEKNKEKILEHLQSIKTEKPYISFTNHHSQEEMLKTSDANIVVTSKQINDYQINRFLTPLLEDNPNHTLIVTIGKNSHYMKETSLNIDYAILMQNLKSLRLINPMGSIKSIVNNFMSGHSALISCDLSGLYGLEDIEDSFLFNCESLQSINMLDLTNIKQIGPNFLSACKNLISLNLSAPRTINRIGA